MFQSNGKTSKRRGRRERTQRARRNLAEQDSIPNVRPCCSLVRMKCRAFLLLLIGVLPAVGQHLVPQPVFDAIAGEYSGEAAQENDRAIVQYHRIQGSPMMAEVAEKVVLARLHEWGIEARIEQFPSDGKTRYQTFVSPMGWDMRNGELWVESVGGMANFAPTRICRFGDVPMCVSTYSKGGDWSGELVEVGAGTSDRDYEGKDVRGRVALAYGYAAAVVRAAAIQRGAIGVVIYPPPGDRADHPDMVRYNGIWPRAEELEKTVGGFQISENQYTQLRQLMANGAVRVHGKIDATLGPGQLTVVHAWIRGSSHPETEVVISGHLDHPKWSANDNASGSAAMLEMARTLHRLIASGKLAAPTFTLHFMWVPEYYGTFAYITKHPEARSCSAWDDPRPAGGKSSGCIAVNLNMDMVGEDTVKTNSRFYITRTPDSVGGSLNARMADVLAQTREADLYAPAGSRNYWPAEMAPYAQGSDHDVFLGLGIPATMLGHDPDWTHHTSEDTPEKTDATELRRVGVLASAAAYWAAVNDADANRRLEMVAKSGMIADYAGRIAEIAASPDSAGGRGRLRAYQQALETMTAEPETGAKAFDRDGWARASKAGRVPHRLVVTPLDASAFQSLSGNDQKWWGEQEERFASEAPGGGLPTKPPFGLIAFEAMNFMDGRRTEGEIAALLSLEFNRDFDAVWMERLVGILERANVVKAE
jgi:aminopeptidase YwaD